MSYRTPMALGLTLLSFAVGSLGCSMPCSKAIAESDRRFADLQDTMRRGRDPGGDGYDLVMTLPSALIDASLQRMVASGEVPTRQEQRFDLGIDGLTAGLGIDLRVDLEEVHVEAVPGDPARLQADARLRLRGDTDRELFDVDARVRGPVELRVRNTPSEPPVLYVRLGDLDGSQIDLDGELLGRSFQTALEGLLPTGGLGGVLDAIGVDTGGLTDAIEQTVHDEVLRQAATSVEALLDDAIGEIEVMRLGELDLGAMTLSPQAVGLASGDGWIGVGLRSDLDTGKGTVPLAPPIGRAGGTVQLRVSEAFLSRALQLAYLEGVIPRTLDANGAPADEGPYRVEPLDVQLDDAARFGVRVYRCDDPCGWADLQAAIRPSGTEGDQLAVVADDIEVTGAKGVGKVVEFVLQHQERALGEPVAFTQQISRVLQPELAGAKLTLRVAQLSTAEGVLRVTMTYDLPETGSGRETRPTRGGARGSGGDRGTKEGQGGGRGGSSTRGSGRGGDRGTKAGQGGGRK